MDYQAHMDKAAARLRELEHALAAFDFKASQAQRRFQELNRERQRLESFLTLTREFTALRRQADEARVMLAAEPDPELLELARHDLATVAAHFGIALDHHQAASDARACAEVAIRLWSE